MKNTSDSAALKLQHTGLLGPYLSFTSKTWAALLILSLLIGLRLYADTQWYFQNKMRTAVNQADVLYEFCSRDAGLRADACQTGSRKLPSDQLLWSLLKEAKILNPRDVQGPSSLENLDQLTRDTAVIIEYARNTLGLEQSGVSLFRKTGMLCNTDGADAEIEKDYQTILTALLSDTYPSNLGKMGKGKNRMQVPLKDASFFYLQGSEVRTTDADGIKKLTKGHFQPNLMRTSVSRQVTDAEIVSTLFALSGGFAPDLGSDVNQTPSFALESNCQGTENMTTTEERFRYMEARGKLSLFIAGRIRTSEPVKAARFWMTLFTGPEQMAIFVTFVFGLFTAILRITTLMRARVKEASLPGNFQYATAPEFMAENRDTWQIVQKQIVQKMVSARWPLKTTAVVLPAIGFIGTVRGIMNSLSGADEIVWAVTVNERSAAISALSSELGLAFATTLLALASGLVLTILMAIDGRLSDIIVLRSFDAITDNRADI